MIMKVKMVKLTEDVHKRLKVYQATNGITTLSEAINNLLDALKKD